MEKPGRKPLINKKTNVMLTLDMRDLELLRELNPETTQNLSEWVRKQIIKEIENSKYSFEKCEQAANTLYTKFLAPYDYAINDYYEVAGVRQTLKSICLSLYDVKIFKYPENRRSNRAVVLNNIKDAELRGDLSIAVKILDGELGL